jgi:DNA modification methylase
MLPVAGLQPHPRNYNRHPEPQVKRIAASLRQFGQVRPIVVHRDTIIAGHGVYQAAQHLGYQSLRCTVLPADWTDEQAMAYLVTDNETRRGAEPDVTELAALLDELQQDFDLDSLGFDEQEYSALLDGLTPDLPAPSDGGDEFEPDEAAPCRVQAGDVWLIGGVHRLICGDCTDPATVDRLMQGERADAVFTSPPYDQQRTYEGHMAADWIGLMCGVFSAVLSCLEDNAQIFVNLGLVHRNGRVVRYWDVFITWMEDAAQSWPLFGWYVWDKLNGMPGDWNGRLAPAHEWVFHFTREGVRPDKTVKTKEGNRTGETQRNPDGTLKKFTHACAPVQPFKIPDSVVRTPQVTGSREYGDHPAPFPLALPETFIEAYNVDLWLDPFLGSGTTIIAAHRNGRRCYGCEISPKYCEVILQRCEAEGLTVEKVSTAAVDEGANSL